MNTLVSHYKSEYAIIHVIINCNKTIYFLNENNCVIYHNILKQTSSRIEKFSKKCKINNIDFLISIYVWLKRENKNYDNKSQCAITWVHVFRAIVYLERYIRLPSFINSMLYTPLNVLTTIRMLRFNDIDLFREYYEFNELRFLLV